MKNFILLLVFITGPLWALEEAYTFEDATKQKLFTELTQELRCPQCQNQNIADSDAMIAHDLRRKVYELINQGQTRDEIVGFMKSRYGDFVSYKPPVTPLTIWLWLLPVIFVLGAAFFVFNQRKKQVNDFDEDVLAKADSLLEKDDE